MRTLLASCLAVLALAGCSQRTPPPDESTLESLRLLLQTRECMRRMQWIDFAVAGAYPVAPDTMPPPGMPSLVADSLRTCPSSGLPYEFAMDSTGYEITCPAGHGSVGRSF